MAYIQKDKVAAREAYKKLTKPEKIGHLWYYYKWHVIVTLFVVIAASTFIYGVVTRVHPDLTILYLTRQPAPRDHIAALEEHFALHIEDANNDGRLRVSIMPISFDLNQPNPDNMIMLQRLQTQLVSGDAKLFIADDMFLDRLEFEGVVAKSALITNREYIEQLDLFVVTSVVYARNTRGRHVERHEREHENAERIFKLLTE
ncbi:MAG: hypothetical protein FWE04_00695 [Oscillospiraceae bacterium]|nr:hypothetical protein [Oscillospiraceae bacterium]